MSGGFRVKDLFRLREPDDPPDVFPAEVNLWGYATTVALSTGLIAGLLRGARQGYAIGRARAKVQGVDAAREKKFVSSMMMSEAVRSSLREGLGMGLFVAGLLGADVVALEHEWLRGPAAPAVGGALAAAVRTARRGKTAWTGAVVMGGMMGLVFGLVRQGFGERYSEFVKREFGSQQKVTEEKKD